MSKGEREKIRFGLDDVTVACKTGFSTQSCDFNSARTGPFGHIRAVVSHVKQLGPESPQHDLIHDMVL